MIYQVPGYQNDALSEQEKHWLYVSTFPTSWAQSFDLHKNIDTTSFKEINNYMCKQKEEADKKKKQVEREKKNNEEEKKNPNKKNNQDKYKLDLNATYGPQARCTKCSDAKNSWGNCF